MIFFMEPCFITLKLFVYSAYKRNIRHLIKNIYYEKTPEWRQQGKSLLHIFKMSFYSIVCRMSVARSDLMGLLFLWPFSTTQPRAHWLFEKFWDEVHGLFTAYLLASLIASSG